MFFAEFGVNNRQLIRERPHRVQARPACGALVQVRIRIGILGQPEGKSCQLFFG